eukprot:329569-Chlamydomonas_euryale.AAC.5
MPPASLVPTTAPSLIPNSHSDIPRVLQCTVARIPTKPTRKGGHGGGSSVVSTFVPYKSHSTGQHAKVTLLYSHGNAVDLGQMLPVYRCANKLHVKAFSAADVSCMRTPHA